MQEQPELAKRPRSSSDAGSSGRRAPFAWWPGHLIKPTADSYIVSIPKSGRTWLRFGLRHYQCRLAGVEFDIKPGKAEKGQRPIVQFSHDLWAHRTAPRWIDRFWGRYVIPRSARRHSRFLLLYRDLKDVMVSMHLQLTRRSFHSGASFDGSLKELIRDPVLGVEATVDTLNDWIEEWRGSGRFMLWIYEEARKHPVDSLREVLEFCGFAPINEQWLAEAVDFSSFDKMKAMEKERKFDHTILRPGDPGDPDSFKVRRGKVGGYLDYMDAEDIACVDAAIERLRL